MRDLRKWYDIRGGIIPRVRGHVRAVDGVSFAVRPGEVLGIAGESGSGKSTIGRCVLRLIEPTSGEIRFAGRDVTQLDRRELRLFRRKAQMIFQDPYGSLDPLMTHRRHRRRAARRAGHGGRRDAAARTRARAARHGGARARNTPTGGRTSSRAASASVSASRARLSVGPELLVADEPVSALDVSIQAQIVNLLDELKQRLNLAMLFISHDIAVMDHLSDRIAIVYLGRIMEIGPTRALIDGPRHPYTEALLSAVPEPGVKRRERIVLTGRRAEPGRSAERLRVPHPLPLRAARLRGRAAAAAAGRAGSPHRLHPGRRLSVARRAARARSRSQNPCFGWRMT